MRVRLRALFAIFCFAACSLMMPHGLSLPPAAAMITPLRRHFIYDAIDAAAADITPYAAMPSLAAFGRRLRDHHLFSFFAAISRCLLRRHFTPMMVTLPACCAHFAALRHALFATPPSFHDYAPCRLCDAMPCCHALCHTRDARALRARGAAR